jgi:hypothetical protein
MKISGIRYTFLSPVDSILPASFSPVPDAYYDGSDVTATYEAVIYVYRALMAMK